MNNVLVDSAGCAVLTDFGISRVCDERLRQKIDVTKNMLTGTNAERHVLGTRGYMAPRPCRDCGNSPRRDLFQAGFHKQPNEMATNNRMKRP